MTLESVNIYTPEELLSGARELLQSGNPQFRRAAVLEAITALEVFINTRIFIILKGIMDENLVSWMEKKTRMDFDTRLGLFTPIALNQQIDKTTKLWNDYKKARDIRNKVTHSGIMVSVNEAKFVIQAIYDWLAFLDTTIEIDIALINLKNYIESVKIRIDSGSEAENLVFNYFKKVKTKSGIRQVRMPNGRFADLFLKFGDNTILIEIKFLIGNIIQYLSYVEETLSQIIEYVDYEFINRFVIILFQKGEIPESYERLRYFKEGKITILGIKIT